jgi:hypothetical protein
MTYRNKVLSLGAAAGILALAIALGIVFSPANNQRRSASATMLSEKARAKVGAIGLTVDGGSLTIRKNGAGWAVDKGGVVVAASAEKIEAFLDAVQSVREMYKVSSKKESQGQFGLEPATKRIILSDASGKEILNLKLGKADTGNKSIYAAFEGKDAVYSVKNSFESYVRLDDRSWVDLRLIQKDIKDSDVQEMDIQAELPESSGQEALIISYHLKRDSRKGWKAVGNDGLQLDPNLVNQYVRSLVRLESDSLVGDKKDEAASLIAKPIATIRLLTGKGLEYRIIASAQDGEKRHVLKEAGSETMFYTSSWTLRNNLKKLDSLQYVEEPKKKAEAKK